MKKILILGSVVSPCPPLKHGGTERVAYYQAKHLAKKGLKIIFVGAIGTKKNFYQQLDFEKEEKKQLLLGNIEFIEIGGGTQFGNAKDSIKSNPIQEEASRKLRIEMLNLAEVQKLIIEKKDEYNMILNNMRGEAIFFSLIKLLKKRFINVCHLNIFPKLASFFAEYEVEIITISDNQRKDFPNLKYLSTIYNPISTKIFAFNPKPKNYALMISTIGYHKNQKDAILACQKADIPLVLAGKIRDQDYFEKEIKPYIDDKNVIYYSELGFEEKLKLYQEAKMFLFPILWQEPFGLVCIEALSCGTPVIAYPNGGPKEIVKDKINGFLVKNFNEMAKKIKEIDKINRLICRKDCQSRFDENIIGNKYFDVLSKLI